MADDVNGLDDEDRRIIEAMRLAPADYCHTKTPPDLSDLDEEELEIIRLTGVTPDEYRAQKAKR